MKLIHNQRQNEKDLVRLARALYNAALHENDKSRLEYYRQTAVSLSTLINDTVNKEGLLHPDLGISLILFIEGKASGSPQSEDDRRDADEILTELETSLS